MAGTTVSFSDALIVNDVHAHEGSDVGNSVHLKNDNQVISTEAMATLETVADTLLDPTVDKSMSIDSALNAAANKMDVESAAKLIDRKTLTPDVSHLVQTVGAGDVGFSSGFSEDSLAKARLALNELVEKAWIELDDKIFKCKGFQDMNRENYAQVTRDIMRLIEQINDLERMEAEAIEGIAGKEQDIMDAQALLAKETKLYNIEYAENKAELTIRQNDLDVFQFILVFTKCPDATSLSQTKAKVCETQSGRRTLLFDDTDVAVKYKKLLTPSSKETIDNLLRAVEKGKKASLLQQQPADTDKATPAGPKDPLPVAKKAPVQGEDGKPCVGSGVDDECMKSCNPDETPDCALLHDKLSLMWGEFKDKVDELTMEMMKNEFEFSEVKSNLNNQIKLLVKSKARFAQLLAESRSNLAADRTELKEKYRQKEKLDKQYYTYMAACKKRIQWIMYQDMCAIKIVRNAVMENSTVCPSAEIQDCDMDAWIPESCSVSCDDSCDPNQPFKCGGWQKMVRKPVVPHDECGIRCPLAEKFKRCGQFLCPINCHMSSWSGWSKCTAECEGGLQSHTRSILVKPKNGGNPCNTVEESRACNTMSCDRNCKLQRWTKWTPCSVACGGGFQEKFRHVLVPIRGEGKCPKETSYFRYGKQMCNEQQCVGDEICVAVQDLVIAVDGSGSLRQSGFEILKKFVTTLVKKYRTEYWGAPAVKIGLVLFGNGVIMPDGKTVSPAINAQKLTFDFDAVLSAVEGLPFKKGFTNMAQAFSMAEDMFVKGSRKFAQSSVMVVTDGKPSFSFMTNEMVEKLDDKSIMRYFVVINEDGPQSDAMKQMRKWASQPWETNLVHVMGLEILDADTGVWVEKAVTKFCPMATSPSTAAYERQMFGYQFVKKAGFCGELEEDNLLGRGATEASDCAAMVQEHLFVLPEDARQSAPNTFVLGKDYRRGWCFLGTVHATEDEYKAWESSKERPACSAGEWKEKSLYDFYAIEPAKPVEPPGL